MRTRGFTLIELLVVIAIIAVLAAILFPVFARAREKANQTTCLNNQRQISTGFHMYLQDHDEMFPLATSWTQDLSGSYGLVGGVWDCPTSSYIGKPSAPDYFFVAGSFLANRPLSEITSPDKTPLTGDLVDGATSKPYVDDSGQNDIPTAVATVDFRHDGSAIFSFVDGHVAAAPAATVGAGFFAPCLPASTLDNPVYLGTLWPIAMVYSSSVANPSPTALLNLGIDTVFGMCSYWGSEIDWMMYRAYNGTTTSACIYVWDSTTGNLTTKSCPGGFNLPSNQIPWMTYGNNTNTQTYPVTTLVRSDNSGIFDATGMSGWPAQTGYSCGTLTAISSATNETITFTIVPSSTVTSKIVKNFALYFNSRNTSTGTTKVNYITDYSPVDKTVHTYNFGTKVASIPRYFYNSNQTQALLFSLPIYPGQPIVINFTNSGTQYGGSVQANSTLCFQH